MTILAYFFVFRHVLSKAYVSIYKTGESGNYDAEVDINGFKTGFRHFAWVYRHDQQKGLIFYNGVKVLERDNFVCLRQPCLISPDSVCIDEVRIMRAAMYTEDFTPPTEPF